MKVAVFFIALFTTLYSYGQASDQSAVKAVLEKQTESWNKGDLEGFMQGYWHNDSLMFIGKNGIRWGWKAALAGYKKGYPDTTAMGKLFFEILVVKKLSPQYIFVVGKFYLKRSIGDLSGHYDLVFKKINGHWLIISDHTS